MSGELEKLTVLLLPFANLAKPVTFAVLLTLCQNLHVDVCLLLLLLLTAEIALLLLEFTLLITGQNFNTAGRD